MRHPHTSTPGVARPVRAMLAALVAAATSLALTARPAAAAPSYPVQERAAAVAAPALVFLEFRLEGFLRTRATGALVEAAPVVVYSRCSGFMVNPDGYAVTTTQCMKPTADVLRGVAAATVADDLVRAGAVTAAQKSAYIALLTATTDFTGASAKAAPIITVTAQAYTAVTGSASAKTVTAKVVDFQTGSQGETTLVKLDRRDLPAAQLVDSPLPKDQRVITIGYGAGDAGGTPVVYTAQARGGTIIGHTGNSNPPRYGIADDVIVNSLGSMVTDADGRVLGMITIGGGAAGNRVVIPTSTITKLLDANGITNTLAPVDQTYRGGLDAFFGGRYGDAVTAFNAVLAAEPDNVIAQTYRGRAAEGLNAENRATRNRVIVVVIAAVAVLGSLGGVFVVVLRRRRTDEFLYFDPYPPAVAAPVPAQPPMYATPAGYAPISAVTADPSLDEVTTLYVPPVSYAAVELPPDPAPAAEEPVPAEPIPAEPVPAEPAPDERAAAEPPQPAGHEPSQRDQPAAGPEPIPYPPSTYAYPYPVMEGNPAEDQRNW
jgi:hypothetical protein